MGEFILTFITADGKYASLFLSPPSQLILRSG